MAQSARMKHQADGIDRLAQKIGGTVLVELRQGAVRQHDVPVSVQREGRVGLVRLKDLLDRQGRGDIRILWSRGPPFLPREGV